MHQRPSADLASASPAMRTSHAAARWRYGPRATGEGLGRPSGKGESCRTGSAIGQSIQSIGRRTLVFSGPP